MKRLGNIFDKIISVENLVLAEQKARKGKGFQRGIKFFDKNADKLIAQLHYDLENNLIQPPKYHTKTIFEPKERLIFVMEYYPHRIIQHAILNILEPMFLKHFISQTYASIKGKGINGVRITMQKYLKDVKNTKYCLSFDIKKCYPSINHDVLKALVRKKVKDKRVLNLIDMYIDSADGLPIGNYLSQFLANYYFSFFDHYVKEVLRDKYYIRYMDDGRILSASKKRLHYVLNECKAYLERELKVKMKGNYQIFPIDKRGIDFVGFRFYHGYTLIRKRIKKNLCRKVAKINHYKMTITNKERKMMIASWIGWCKYSNSKNLQKTLNIYELCK